MGIELLPQVEPIKVAVEIDDKNPPVLAEVTLDVPKIEAYLRQLNVNVEPVTLSLNDSDNVWVDYYLKDLPSPMNWTKFDEELTNFGIKFGFFYYESRRIKLHIDSITFFQLGNTYKTNLLPSDIMLSELAENVLKHELYHASKSRQSQKPHQIPLHESFARYYYDPEEVAARHSAASSYQGLISLKGNASRLHKLAGW